MKLIYKVTIGICIGLFLSACGSGRTSVMTQNPSPPPETWQMSTASQPISDNWLAVFGSEEAEKFATLALENNFNLKQQAFQVQIQEQRLIGAGGNLWPQLDFNVSQNRSENLSAGGTVNTASASLDLTYELDIWGKLSANQKQENLNLMSAKANYQRAEQELVSSVVIAWIEVIEADLLLKFFNQRVSNARQNLDIIDSGYRLGLNSALDIYLARNDLNTELSRVSEQEAIHIATLRRLENLIGEYPRGDLFLEKILPNLNTDIPLGLPSELITRRPDLLSAWYRLLANDAGVAFAHKARFPSINVSANLNRGNETIGDLLSGTDTFLSLIGRITAPIFKGGQLEAEEKIARLTLKQSEQAYLETLNRAFTEVENAITQEQSLNIQYERILEAQENAIIAADLSFDQYQKGLVNYATVLEAQRRAFDAQTSAIQTKTQLYTNRIKLHVALGGSFSDTVTVNEAINKES